MKSCTDCGSQNLDSSRFCLECGSPLGAETSPLPAKARASKRGIIFYSVVGFAALALLVAGIASLVMFSEDSSPRKTAIESASDLVNEITGANGEASAGERAGVSKTVVRKLAGEAAATGERLRAGDLVVSVGRAVRSGGASMEKPARGDVFVVCDVTVHNDGKKPAALSTMLEMSLLDRQGTVYPTGIFFPRGSFPDGEVAAGSTASGKVAFEVPAKTGDLYFVFDPEVLRDGEEVAVRLF